MKLCKNCNQEITSIKRNRDKNKQFCNRKCVAQYYKKHARVCLTCSTPLKKQKKYCSYSCRSSSLTVTHIRICATCNKEFKLKNIAYEKRDAGKYCSQSCSSRRYSLNEECFDVIDTPEKAYWLGFLFADGYNSGYEVVVRLSSKDHNHNKLFLRFLKSKSTPKLTETHSIARVGSKKLCSALTNHGCIKSKTFSIEYPDIPEELDRDFIRGYFDGDGCMYVPKGKSYGKFSMYSASDKFREQINTKLNNHGIKSKVYRKIVYVGKRKQIGKLHDFLYKDAGVFLQRKLDKFKLVVA